MTPISRLNLKPSIENPLASAGIRTIESLAEKSERELLKIMGIGPHAIREISVALAVFGFALQGCGVVSMPVTGGSSNTGLRDYFAGQALRCLTNDETNIHGTASTAYQIADAMLVARNLSTDHARIGAK